MTVTDWRGTPIVEGSLLVYGAGVGRSIELVEAVYTGELTETGRLWVRVWRRSYSGGGTGCKTRVHIGADRVTVVQGLADSDLPTEDERIIQSLKRSIQWRREELDALTDETRPLSYFDSIDEQRASWTSELRKQERKLADLEHL